MKLVDFDTRNQSAFRRRYNCTFPNKSINLGRIKLFDMFGSKYYIYIPAAHEGVDFRQRELSVETVTAVNAGYDLHKPFLPSVISILRYACST
jgi:hypothetical protein